MYDCLYINFVVAVAVADAVAVAALLLMMVHSSSVVPQPLDDGHEVIV